MQLKHALSVRVKTVPVSETGVTAATLDGEQNVAPATCPVCDKQFDSDADCIRHREAGEREGKGSFCSIFAFYCIFSVSYYQLFEARNVI